MFLLNIGICFCIVVVRIETITTTYLARETSTINYIIVNYVYTSEFHIHANARVRLINHFIFACYTFAYLLSFWLFCSVLYAKLEIYVLTWGGGRRRDGL